MRKDYAAMLLRLGRLMQELEYETLVCAEYAEADPPFPEYAGMLSLLAERLCVTTEATETALERLTGKKYRFTHTGYNIKRNGDR